MRKKHLWLVFACRPQAASGAGGDAEAEAGGGQTEGWAESQRSGDHHHLQRGGGGKDLGFLVIGCEGSLTLILVYHHTALTLIYISNLSLTLKSSFSNP